MILEGLLDALGSWGSDVLVDGERLLQVVDAFMIVAVFEVAAADSFQGTCFFERCADVAGDGQRLVVIVARVLAVCAPGR